MRVSVIMPCFNTEQEIHRLTQMAIESIWEAGNVETIIVDNGSTFAPGYLKSVSDIYIRNKTNLGYPAAVNQGLEVATGDVMCISNNDVRVPANIFRVGLKILKDPKIGSVHFKDMAYDHPFNFGDKVWKFGKERWCTSSFFLIKREALPEGNYDLDYGVGGFDDWDFWHRVRHVNGWITAYTNKSAYQHWGSWTLSQVPQVEIDANREIFKKKFGEEPEEIWMSLYPDQMKADYYKGFE